MIRFAFPTIASSLDMVPEPLFADNCCDASSTGERPQISETRPRAYFSFLKTIHDLFQTIPILGTNLNEVVYLV